MTLREMILRGRVALTKKVLRPIKGGVKVVFEDTLVGLDILKAFIIKNAKKILVGLGILAMFVIVGITSRNVTSPDFSSIWSNVWPVLAWIGGVIMLIAILWWTRPDPRKWAWKKIVWGTVIVTAVLIFLGPTLFLGATDIYRWAMTKQSTHTVSYSTRDDSASGPRSVLLTARPVWSEWHTMPLDSSARFITDQKGLTIKFRSPSGREVVVRDDPDQKRNLSELGIMAEATAFQVQSETGGDLSFTVYYTPKGR